MFNNLIDTAKEFLTLGNVQKAIELLDKARDKALGKEEHKMAHDLGNAIQREIFAQYTGK